MRVAVFVVDGHDIDLYPDAEGAAREIEGYDAMSLDYFGGDGTVYMATLEGPERGPVTLPPTKDNLWTTWSVCFAQRQKTEACRCRLKPQTTPRRSGVRS
jgi:hypothetical protein